MKALHYFFLLIFTSSASIVTAQETLDENATDCPCCAAEYRAFDFWIGSWEVRDADGALLGTNRIERGQDGCLLQEHWQNASGSSTGSSFNYFNRSEQRWEQLWVDRFGNVLKLRGNWEGNRMVLRSEPFISSEGDERRHQISWTLNDDGSVRQLWEVLQEDAVVQTLFDGYYRRL